MKKIFISAVASLFSFTSIQAQSDESTKIIRFEFPGYSGSEQSKPVLSQDKSKLYFVETFDESVDGISSQDIWVADFVAGGKIKGFRRVDGLSDMHNNAVVSASSINTDKLFLLSTYSKKERLWPGVSFSRFSESGWSKPEALKIKGLNINSQFFDFFVTPDEEAIFITMPEGLSGGDLDLFVSTRMEDGNYDKPVRLSLSDDTGNDISPFFDPASQKLFFSSVRGGAEGLANMDIYSAKKGEDWLSWETIERLPEPINSNSFDAYFATYKGEGSFFSSDRKDSLSAIYFINLHDVDEPIEEVEEVVYNTAATDDGLFNYEELKGENANLYAENPEDYNVTVEGNFKYKNLAREGEMLYLVDANGDIIDSTLTGPDGSFNFSQLPADGQYSIKVANEDYDLDLVSVEAGKKITAKEIVRAEDGLFPYRELKGEKAALFAANPDDYDVTVDGRFKYNNLAQEGQMLYMVNANGDIIDSTLTGPDGKFSFSKLPADGKYAIKVTNEDYDIDLVDIRAGKNIKAKDIVRQEDRVFDYQPLSASQVEMIKGNPGDYTQYVAGKFQYDNLPLDGSKIGLVDENDVLIATAITDKDGKFIFKNLPPDDMYRLKPMGEFDDISKIKITASKGFNQVDVIADDKINKPTPDGDVPVIYYGFDKVYPSIKYLNMLRDQVLPLAPKKIKVYGHTDAAGNPKINQNISKSRALIIKDWLVRKGYPANKIEVEWFGETQPAKSNDTYEGRRKNRRVVVK